MNVFEFKNYEEFGLFFKINSSQILLLSGDPEVTKEIEEYIKIYEHGKGGCGCNIAKRKQACADKYESFVPQFFSDNEPAISLVKSLLGNVNAVAFKKAATDETSFFLI